MIEKIPLIQQRPTEVDPLKEDRKALLKFLESFQGEQEPRDYRSWEDKDADEVSVKRWGEI
jgi:hypothetical protein